MSETLLVPPPAFAFTAIPGGFAPIGGVVTAAFPAVRFPDGTAMTIDHYAGAFALLSRTLTPGAAAQRWNAVLNAWGPADDGVLMLLGGFPLLPPVDGAEPWRAVLVPSVQRDAAGVPMFANAAINGFPQYRMRGLFRARRDATEALGLGPEGPALRFASGSAQSGPVTIESDVVITGDLDVGRVRYLPAAGPPKKTLV
jgi:hypothetical protein